MYLQWIKKNFDEEKWGVGFIALANHIVFRFSCTGTISIEWNMVIFCGSVAATYYPYFLKIRYPGESKNKERCSCLYQRKENARKEVRLGFLTSPQPPTPKEFLSWSCWRFERSKRCKSGNLVPIKTCVHLFFYWENTFSSHHLGWYETVQPKYMRLFVEQNHLRMKMTRRNRYRHRQCYRLSPFGLAIDSFWRRRKEPARFRGTWKLLRIG